MRRSSTLRGYRRAHLGTRVGMPNGDRRQRGKGKGSGSLGWRRTNAYPWMWTAFKKKGASLWR